MQTCWKARQLGVDQGGHLSAELKAAVLRAHQIPLLFEIQRGEDDAGSAGGPAS